MTNETGRTATQLVWLTSADGMLYTSPRMFTIERLPNGYYRMFHYGPNMAELFESTVCAVTSAEETARRLARY